MILVESAIADPPITQHSIEMQSNAFPNRIIFHLNFNWMISPEEIIIRI